MFSQVRGTGEGGRVTKKDILAYVENKPQVAGRAEDCRHGNNPALATCSADWRGAGSNSGRGSCAGCRSTTLLPGDEWVPLSSMRRSIAEHMAKSKTISPHVTTVFEVDLSRVMAHREANRPPLSEMGPD